MIRKGDRVFYSDNGIDRTSYYDVALLNIRDLGLIPIMYQNVGINIKNSSLDREIRGDFYKSKVVVIVFGKGPRWKSSLDHWAIPELKHAISFGIFCFVYVTGKTSGEEVKGLVASTNLSVDRIVVGGEERQFEITLRQNLEQLM